MTNKSNLQAHKECAVDFLQLVVAGSIEEAYDTYVNMHGKHHNVYFASDFTSLKKAMLEDHEHAPTKRLMVKNVLADGDCVAVHSHLVLKAGEPGMAVVHIFRFEQGKIIEMWDVAQVLPVDSPNRVGAF